MVVIASALWKETFSFGCFYYSPKWFNASVGDKWLSSNLIRNCHFRRINILFRSSALFSVEGMLSWRSSRGCSSEELPLTNTINLVKDLRSNARQKQHCLKWEVSIPKCKSEQFPIERSTWNVKIRLGEVYLRPPKIFHSGLLWWIKGWWRFSNWFRNWGPRMGHHFLFLFRTTKKEYWPKQHWFKLINYMAPSSWRCQSLKNLS